ncbi:hypothetical protein HYALB_00011354 [Hymenoscyphus albidus]|uniref:C2H2-type domain-containing protein n=1 Tax=Hymenoscyphus albidus TaxID=595503 RepID=A0A9N9LRH9_9HELO|nr:hypothetical protein HYALB_00011354 [Hymenoscyphus albidus]
MLPPTATATCILLYSIFESYGRVCLLARRPFCIRCSTTRTCFSNQPIPLGIASKQTVLVLYNALLVPLVMDVIQVSQGNPDFNNMTSASVRHRIPCQQRGCNKTFTAQQNMLRHDREIHGGIKRGENRKFPLFLRNPEVRRDPASVSYRTSSLAPETAFYGKDQLLIEEVQGNNCLTNFRGLNFTSDRPQSLVRQKAEVASDDLWQAASQTVNAMVKFPGSQEPNETGFALANNTTKSAFENLSGDPQRARRFGSAMKAYIEETGFDIQFVADNYPWKEFGNATVVDVGGSHGFACTHLSNLFPSLKFVVQDLPPVVEAGAKTIPKDLSERIQFMAHDFFEEQPVHSADIYFFRWIFHNWSDKNCIKILQALIPALKKGAKILINDNVLPEPGVLPMWREEKVRAMDLTMLELQNARERELEDWAKLFEDADPRFKFLGGKQPRGASLWILEAVWEG